MRNTVSLTIAGIFLSASVLFAQATPAPKDEVFQLNDQIAKKREEVDVLRKQADAYKKNIELKQQQAATLENQVAILDATIARFTTEIKATQTEVDETQLEIDQIEREVEVKSEDITDTKEMLAAQVRLLDQTTLRSPIELLLSEETLSMFLERLHAIDQAQRDTLTSLSKIQELRQRLEATRAAFFEKQKTLELLDQRLGVQRQSVTEQRSLKERMLGETKQTEALFQNLLSQLRAEQQGIDAEIGNLERTIRERLKLIDTQYEPNGKMIFSWPVEPTRGISAYFHDPTYPFRNVFEHPAIDIRAAQGTAVKAAAPGYIARAHDGGLGYSYVMIVHPGGFATVYGHVSRILVKEDAYVDRNDVIALSGGTPGTAGAGRLTTGPHLHFEIRVDGIPVNPFEYLL